MGYMYARRYKQRMQSITDGGHGSAADAREEKPGEDERTAREQHNRP